MRGPILRISRAQRIYGRNLQGKGGKSQTSGLHLLSGAVDVDGNPILQSININQSMKKQQDIVRGGHHSVKMVTAVWPQQVSDL